MKGKGLLLFIALGLLGLASGAGLLGKSGVETNVCWTFTAISFALCLAFPPLAVLYARSRSAAPLPRPSFARGFQGDWWSDPLQCLRATLVFLAGLVLGGGFSAIGADGQGVMLFWWQVAMLTGLVLGERVVYVAFHKDIA
jgi:hypothetical protein